MKDKVIIHGVEYVPKVVTGPAPAKVGRWKPEDDEIGEYYYYIGDNCLICKSAWLGDYDVDRYKFGNCYQTKELATRARDRQLLLVELQDFAAQKNEGKDMPKYCYFLVKYNNKWDWASSSNLSPGTVRFRNREGALDAIAHFGDRLDLLL